MPKFLQYVGYHTSSEVSDYESPDSRKESRSGCRIKADPVRSALGLLELNDRRELPPSLQDHPAYTLHTWGFADVGP